MFSARHAAVAAAFLFFSGGLSTATLAHAAPLQYGYGQERDHAGWDVPPPNLSQTQANGFRDGLGAGQDDIARHIQPNATGRPEYRNPPQMPFLQRVMYRDGFQKGYQRAMDHFYGTPVPPPPPPPQPVAPPPPPYPDRNAYMDPGQDYGRRGFQEGMLGALHDLDHNRRPDPGNRDEFRNPGVPYQAAHIYREGFRRGYDEAMRAMTGMPDGPMRGPQGDVMMRGYHDGAAGAIRDWDNHRRPDPDNRDEFRSPNVPPPAQHDYRDSFRRGYRRLASQLF